jgi:hypothetical protein
VEPLTQGAASEVAAEGRRLLRFVAAEAECHNVCFAAVAPG